MFDDDDVLADIDINDPFGSSSPKPNKADPFATPTIDFSSSKKGGLFDSDPLPPTDKKESIPVSAPVKKVENKAVDIVDSPDPLATPEPVEPAEPLVSEKPSENIQSSEISCTPEPFMRDRVSSHSGPLVEETCELPRFINGQNEIQSDIETLGAMTPPLDSYSNSGENIARRESRGDALFCTVSDSQNVADTLGSHVEYLVEARKTLKGPTHSSVRRRYNHFGWLEMSLIAENPAVIVPPLPLTNLTVLFGNKTSHRMKSLEIFLNRVSCHPVLSKNPAFNQFLTGDPSTFTTPTSKVPVNALKPSGGLKKNHNEKLMEIAATNRVLEVNWTNIDQCEVTFSNLNYGIHSKDYANFIKAIENLGATEATISSTISTFAHYVDNLKTMSEEYIEIMAEKYLIPFHELRRTIQSINRALCYRDDLQTLNESLDEQLDKKTNEKARVENGETTVSMGKLLRKTDDQIKREKLDNLTSDINSLTFRKEEATKLLKSDGEVLHEELAKWDNQRRRECKALLNSQADVNIKFCEKNLKELKSLLCKLESIKN